MPAEQSNMDNLSLSGSLAVTGLATFSTPIKKDNLNASVKRQRMIVPLAPITGAAADSTNYSGWFFPGVACTVTGIALIVETPPTVGTDVFTAKKGSSSGNTMLSAASYNCNSLVANTGQPMTLTTNATDLQLTATQGAHLRYAAGVQTVDAINMSVVVEYEVTDA